MFFCSTYKMGIPLKVIIVGGGISGIKAAVELENRGIDYVVLEAKNRLGGRLHTVQGLNTKYDLGASWFHETLNNALFDEEKSLDEGTETYFDDMELAVYDFHGKVPSSSKLASISNEIKQFVEIESYKHLSQDESLYDTVIKYLKSRHHLLTRYQVEHALEYTRSLELWHGIDVKRLSAKYSSMDNAGRDALAKNYDTMLSRHIKVIPKEKIRLSQVVDSVIRTNKNKTVQIKTAAGEIFEADFAIITVPQSILQLQPIEKGCIKFTPELPADIREALSKISFGALGKVVLEFDEIFWPLDSERFLVLASSLDGFYDSIINDDEVPAASYSEIPKPWEYPVLFLNFGADFNVPSLVALTQSPVTDYLEANPDYAWEFLKSKVQVIAGEKNIPVPKSIITSNWTIDPFQRGSYSACYPGDDPIQAVLALERGFGNVRFAGEHTIMEGAGCVHGAWNSGKREVDYILSQIDYKQ